MSIPHALSRAKSAIPNSDNGNGDVLHPPGFDPATAVWYVYKEDEQAALIALGRDAQVRQSFQPDGRDVVIVQGSGDFYAQAHAPDDAQFAYRQGSTSVRIVQIPTNRTSTLVGIFESGILTHAALEMMAGDARVIEPLHADVADLVPALIANEPIVNKDDFWRSCLHNSRLWLAQQGLADKIRYDRFSRLILVEGTPIDDETVIRFTRMIEGTLRMPWSQEHVRSAIVDVAGEHQFSSLVDWLTSLEWDGTPRVDDFFSSAYGCSKTPYHKECSRVFLISAVARALQPGCKADVMPVLIGNQGILKSMGISRLCPETSWHTDDGIGNLNDKKATGEGLQGKWIVEFSEFTRINRVTIEAVKSFVTRQVDHYRPSYGRTSKDFPRTCVFVGTTNDQYPLHDIENRRFMAIRCVAGKLDWITDNRDQLWAEAVVRYLKGEQWWVTDKEMIEECIRQQEAARLEDAWESILAEGLYGLTHTDMKEAAVILKVEIGRLDKSAQTRIGIALQALGFTRRRVRIAGDRSYAWDR